MPKGIWGLAGDRALGLSENSTRNGETHGQHIWGAARSSQPIPSPRAVLCLGFWGAFGYPQRLGSLPRDSWGAPVAKAGPSHKKRKHEA